VRRYIVSPSASHDLEEIWDFIADDNIEAADILLAEFEKAMGGVAANPLAGHRRSDLTGKPVRFWNVGRYLVVYRPRKRPVEIVAVLHGSRDVAKILRRR
jgi:plasmid stabilization system protein ParE